MQVINKDEFKINKEDIKEAIKQGAVFIYPTDTIYGIGCNALDKEAVQKVRQVKDRYKLPFSVIAPSKEWIKENCVLSKEAEEWLKKLPGPYTLILKLKNKKCMAENVNLGLQTVGVRIPDHWCTELAEAIDLPIVTTSANKTGKDFMTSLDDLDIEIKNKVNFIIYDKELKGRPSKLIDLTGKKLRVIER